MKNENNIASYAVNYVVVISAILFFLVMSGIPIVAVVDAAHDDGLFYRGLENILNGNWLGDYDNRTLAKGPMLSIVGAISADLGIQAKFTEAVIYLWAGGMLFLMSGRIGLPRTLAAALFILILCNPHFWSQPGRRYLRDILYSTWTILAVVFAMGCITAPNLRAQRWFAAGVGFFAGCGYLTREEDIWIITIFATLFGVAAFVCFFRHGSARIFGGWRLKIQLVMIGAGALVAIVSPVVLANYAAYGRAVVSEFRSSEFRAAMGALMRVGDIHPSGYVPVPQSALQSVFQISPITEGMPDYWPKLSEGWAQSGSDLIPAYPNEIAGGWFVWAFRDLVAATGHYSTASTARDFYSQMAKEVNEACDAGRLTCRSRRDTLAPELTAKRMDDFVASFWNSLTYSALMKSNKVYAARSKGANESLLRWNTLIGPLVTEASSENASPDALLLSGWVASTIGPVSIAPSSTSLAQIRKLTTAPGTDVVKYFQDHGTKGLDALRFTMIVDCPAKSCDVAVTARNGESQTFSLITPVSGGIPLKPPFYGHFDVVEKNTVSGLNPPIHEGISVAVAYYAVKFAQTLVPFLTITATFGVLLYVVYFKRHQRSDWLLVLAAASVAAVVMRCLIVAYIDITSWSAINSGYLGACYPFVIIYSVTGTAILARIIDDLLQGRRSR